MFRTKRQGKPRFIATILNGEDGKPPVYMRVVSGSMFIKPDELVRSEHFKHTVRKLKAHRDEIQKSGP